MKMTAEQVSVRMDNKHILQDAGIRVGEGEFVGLIGPNGSGKSTLLKSIYRAIKPEAGWITLDGEDLKRIPIKESARRMAVVRQETSVEFDFSVMEIVMMGRSPHKKLFQPDSEEDSRICADALARVGLDSYAHRSFFTLSGGEKQRVLIARALAQQAAFLVLDEPTNHLDVRYQLQVMDLVKSLGIAVVAALHDLNMAAEYCDLLYAMRGGKIVASGTPEEILHPELIRDVFDVEAEVMVHPITGKKHVYYFSKSYRTALAAREVSAAL